MAVNINFNGRLGADCEVRTSARGNSFVRMRVATDEFRNGKIETAWLNVVDYSDKAQKMAPYLKKGVLISVHGIETVSSYKTKNGEFGISRDIIADRIDFISTNSTNNGESVAEHTHDEPQLQEQSDEVSMDCGILKNPKNDEVVKQTIPSGNSYDDLPF